MNLENQVSSLELSKKLKELGVPQKISPYDAYWVKTSGGNWHLFFLDESEDSPASLPFEWCRAFTVAELGEMLPGAVDGNEINIKKGESWMIGYEDNFRRGSLVFAETEADARAKMLIYLIKNKLIQI